MRPTIPSLPGTPVIYQKRVLPFSTLQNEALPLQNFHLVNHSWSHHQSTPSSSIHVILPSSTPNLGTNPSPHPGEQPPPLHNLSLLSPPLSSPSPPPPHPRNVTPPQRSCKRASKQAKPHRQPRNTKNNRKASECSKFSRAARLFQGVIPLPDRMFLIRRSSWAPRWITVLVAAVEVSARTRVLVMKPGVGQELILNERRLFVLNGVREGVLLRCRGGDIRTNSNPHPQALLARSNTSRRRRRRPLHHRRLRTKHFTQHRHPHLSTTPHFHPLRPLIQIRTLIHQPTHTTNVPSLSQVLASSQQAQHIALLPVLPLLAQPLNFPQTLIIITMET